MKAIRHLVNLPGLRISVETNRETFTESVAQTAGSLAYTTANAISGRAWDDSVKVVNAGDATAEKTKAIAASSTKQLSLKATESTLLLKLQAAAVVDEVIDSGKRVGNATADRILTLADRTIAEPVRGLALELGDRRRSAVEGLRKKVDDYCMDQVRAELDSTPALPSAPSPKPRKRRRKLSDVIRKEVEA
jgi:hypothetical protein